MKTIEGLTAEQFQFLSNPDNFSGCDDRCPDVVFTEDEDRISDDLLCKGLVELRPCRFHHHYSHVRMTPACGKLMGRIARRLFRLLGR